MARVHAGSGICGMRCWFQMRSKPASPDIDILAQFAQFAQIFLSERSSETYPKALVKLVQTLK